MRRRRSEVLRRRRLCRTPPVNGVQPEIVVKAVGEGDRILLTVADTGPGIPEADRARAVERFVRLEQSRSLPGSGLGLSLAHAVARLHGGELRLEDNQPGLRSVLALPSERAGAACQCGQRRTRSGRPYPGDLKPSAVIPGLAQPELGTHEVRHFCIAVASYGFRIAAIARRRRANALWRRPE